MGAVLMLPPVRFPQVPSRTRRAPFSAPGARGVWVATILCAQATCERVLAALVSLRELPGAGIKGPKNWEKWGLGTLIKHVRAQGWVPEDLLDEVEVLQR